jgi:hypothetical protein
MKTHTATLASAIFVSAASITYAASTTVNINAIDANFAIALNRYPLA